MTDAEKKTLKESEDACLKRVKDGFGSNGKSSMECENKCGVKITITTFSVFVKPDYTIVIVCAHCAKQLFIKYNYSNKN